MHCFAISHKIKERGIIEPRDLWNSKGLRDRAKLENSATAKNTSPPGTLDKFAARTSGPRVLVSSRVNFIALIANK